MAESRANKSKSRQPPHKAALLSPIRTFATPDSLPKERQQTSFMVGEHVFAKVKGHPEWPGKVETVLNSQKRSVFWKYRVFFYGTNEWSVLRSDQLKPYLGNRQRFAQPKRVSAFNKAIFLIEQEIRELRQQIADKDSSENEIVKSVVDQLVDDVEDRMEQENSRARDVASPSKKVSVSHRKENHKIMKTRYHLESGRIVGPSALRSSNSAQQKNPPLSLGPVSCSYRKFNELYPPPPASDKAATSKWKEECAYFCNVTVKRTHQANQNKERFHSEIRPLIQRAQVSELNLVSALREGHFNTDAALMALAQMKSIGKLETIALLRPTLICALYEVSHLEGNEEAHQKIRSMADELFCRMMNCWWTPISRTDPKRIESTTPPSVWAERLREASYKEHLEERNLPLLLLYRDNCVKVLGKGWKEILVARQTVLKHEVKDEVDEFDSMDGP